MPLRKITDLSPDNKEIIQHVAQVLVEGFKTHWPNAWPDLESALREVQESFGADRINRVAVSDDGKVVGWIGVMREYDGHAWELHPFAVHLDHQGSGIWRALVSDLDNLVRQCGGNTIYLGTDDEDGMTTLSDVDLYPDVLMDIIDQFNKYPPFNH